MRKHLLHIEKKKGNLFFPVLISIIANPDISKEDIDVAYDL
jgi:hypothetical protein